MFGISSCAGVHTAADHGLPRLHPPEVPHSEELALREQFSDIASVLINVNAKKTNVILGEETISLYGPGYIEDTLCGVPVRLGPLLLPGQHTGR